MYKGIVNLRTIKTEYRENGVLIYPTDHQKMFWDMFSMPLEITKDVFDLNEDIDEFTAFTKRDVEQIYYNNNNSGKYNQYLSAKGTDISLRIIRSNNYMQKRPVLR